MMSSVFSLRFAKALCGLLLGLFCCSSQAAEPLQFRHFSSDNNLAPGAVTALTQDNNGKIWIGTTHGISWFDSDRFATFLHGMNQATSLGDNEIHALHTDHQGKVWIGTRQGLSCYNIVGNNFSNYGFAGGEPIRISDIAEPDGGRYLYLATERGLARFDTTDERLETMPLEGVKHIRSLLCVDHSLLLCTSQGLYRYTPEKAGRPARLRQVRSEISVTQAIADTLRGTYWFGTEEQGLYCFDKDFREVAHFDHRTHPESFRSNTVSTLSWGAKDELWIGTPAGLLLYSLSGQTFAAYRSDTRTNPLTDNAVSVILKDNQGGMWIGTDLGGLNYYHTRSLRFDLLESTASVAPEASDVCCLQQDLGSDCGLWIGSNTGHLKHYDEATGRCDDVVRLADGISCLLATPDGSLYIGTRRGGLSLLNADTKRLSPCLTPDATSPHPCRVVLEYAPGILWVGREDGLYLFDRTHGCLSRLFELSSPVNTLFRDSRKRIWIGTADGVYLYQGGEAIPMPNPVGDEQPDRRIEAQCFLEDAQQGIWAGAASGLFLYQEADSSWCMRSDDRHYYIRAMHADKRGHLWLSTHQGLVCYDPTDDLFFDWPIEGVPGSRFVHSFMESAGSTCYIGTLDGVFAFRPDTFADAPVAPVSMIAGVSLQGQAISKIPDNKQVRFLQANNGRLSEVFFPANFKQFKIAFSILNYVSAARPIYAYRLKGYQDAWTTETRWLSRQHVDFSNVPPGRYVFQLKVRGWDGKWCDPSSCVVHITPLWYQTWWGRLLIGCSATLVLTLLVYFYWAKNKMRMQAQWEHFERLKAEELGKEKVSFYINISHELRTPLSLILAPLEEVMSEQQHLKNEVKQSLLYVYRNAQRLLDLVNRLLDFRKVEVGTYPLHVEMLSINPLAHSVYDLFAVSAQKRGLDFEFHSDLPDDERLPIDTQYAETILHNLYSNAFKFTPDGGSIALFIWKKGGQYGFTMRNSGAGIPKEKLSRIFERFYQVDESYRGTGIGLALVKKLAEKHHGCVSAESVEGEYAEFTVALPACTEAFLPEEWSIRDPQEARMHRFVDIDSQPEPAFLLPDDSDTGHPGEDTPSPDDPEEKKTLLLVDDNLEVVAYLKSRLHPEYIVLIAENGEEALDIVKEQKVDLILSDVLMPGIDGIRLCEIIKKNIQTCHIPIMLLSAKGDVESQIQGVAKGADDYIPKPFSIRLLKGKIRNLFRIRQQLKIYYTDTVDLHAEQMTSNPLDEKFIAKAIQTVEDNMGDEQFGVDELANELGMSRSLLYLKMNSVLGEPPANFLRRIRLNKACRLLQEGHHSVSEISTMVGFKSPSYFSTCFKKHKGVMPSEYGKDQHKS